MLKMSVERLPNITGDYADLYSSNSIRTGVFSNSPVDPPVTPFIGGVAEHIRFQRVNVNASLSNAIYTDNGLILPKSISKQSYIIYK